MSNRIRRANESDRAVLVNFNRALAWETEHKHLDGETVTQGVAAVLRDAGKGFYLVFEMEGSVVGQLLITTEWSDWRNGWIWWIQSVYVREDARRSGVFRALYDRVVELAREAGDVVGVRLYVEKANEPAQQTYRSLGMEEGPYLFYERMPL